MNGAYLQTCRSQYLTGSLLKNILPRICQITRGKSGKLDKNSIDKYIYRQILSDTLKTFMLKIHSFIFNFWKKMRNYKN